MELNHRTVVSLTCSYVSREKKSVYSQFFKDIVSKRCQFVSFCLPTQLFVKAAVAIV